MFSYISFNLKKDDTINFLKHNFLFSLTALMIIYISNTWTTHEFCLYHNYICKRSSTLEKLIMFYKYKMSIVFFNTLNRTFADKYTKFNIRVYRFIGKLGLLYLPKSLCKKDVLFLLIPLLFKLLPFLGNVCFTLQ